MAEYSSPEEMSLNVEISYVFVAIAHPLSLIDADLISTVALPAE